MKPILEGKGLSKKYNKSAYALHNLNLTLNHGQIIGLLGPNGSGKTTLIKLINDLLTPTEGTVLIDGELPGVHSKNIVSYLPDHSYLDGSMKIQDLVSYFADFYEDFSKIRARVLFIQNGELVLNATVDDIRSEQKKSVDALFREVFKC